MQRRAQMLEEQRLKEEERNMKLEEERARSEANRVLKEQSKQAKINSRDELVKKLKEEVLAIKLARKENQNLIEQNKNLELLEKTTVDSRNVKNQHREAEEKKEEIGRRTEGKGTG